MRSSAFRYYSALLVDAMKEDLPYDTFPNFTVRQVAPCLPVGWSVVDLGSAVMWSAAHCVGMRVCAAALIGMPPVVGASPAP